MTKKSVQRHSESIIATIMKATCHSIQAYGIERTTVQKIAAHADLAMSTLYKYFRNKDEIYQAIILQFPKDFKLFLKQLNQIMDRLSLEEFIQLFIKEFIDFLMKDHGKYLLIFKYSKSLNAMDQILEAQNFVYETLAPYFKRHIQCSDSRSINAFLSLCLNTMIFSTVNYLVFAPINISLTTDQFATGISNMLQTYIQSINS